MELLNSNDGLWVGHVVRPVVFVIPCPQLHDVTASRSQVDIGQGPRVIPIESRRVPDPSSLPARAVPVVAGLQVANPHTHPVHTRDVVSDTAGQVRNTNRLVERRGERHDRRSVIGCLRGRNSDRGWATGNVDVGSVWPPTNLIVVGAANSDVGVDVGTRTGCASRNPRTIAANLHVGDIVETVPRDDRVVVRIERNRAALSARNGERRDNLCLLYTSPSPRDGLLSRMPSSA